MLINETILFYSILGFGILVVVAIMIAETRPDEEREESERREESEQREEEAAQENIPGPGRVFRDAPFAPEMVEIPAGDFLMGSPGDEKRRYRVEGPQHRVAIPAPFALGKYAVTFDEFDHFFREAGPGYCPSGNKWGRGNRPVINVSWNDAVVYCRWLSKETGHDYRLPTEAEWEYACRAGTTTPFHFGKTISSQQANYGGDFAYGRDGPRGICREKTVEVGQFPANALGLHDMHGNVWEWCADCFEKDAYAQHADVYPGMVGNMEASSDRILRGGSWSNRPRNARCASRTSANADDRSNFSGFRIARTL